MKAIFASKLFRASTRKERIKAALIAPGNLGLVQQLADSLDEEYQVPENLGVNPQPEESDEESIFIDDDKEIDPENDLVKIEDIDINDAGTKSSKRSSSAPKHSIANKPGSPKDNKPETDTSDLMPDSPATDQSKEQEPKEEPAEASTKITSSTDVSINPVPAPSIDLNVLKSTLNSREDTSGANRVAQKDSEIWIYYKDEVNLNNIMTDVIEFLMNTSEYKSFSFNRLARSDNAIVFTISLESYQYPEKPIENTESR